MGVLETGAVISPCNQYRYRLDRRVAYTSGPVYAFFGINPSTADSSTDDATVRKWIGFVRRWGGSHFIVGNVFAYRATDVKALARVSDPLGNNCDHYIEHIIADADILVPCWGSVNKAPASLIHHFYDLERLLLSSGKPVKCFGVTKNGDPKHPLMLAYATELVNYGRA